MKKIFLLGLICLVLLSACSANKEQSTAAEEISEIEFQTEMAQIPEIYEGEYTGNTINDPNYDGLEIQKNEDDKFETNK